MRISEKQVNVLVGTALLALVPLAWLQYRWIGEVSEADQLRRKGELRVAMERIAQETDRDATALHTALIGQMGEGDVPLARRIRELREREQMMPVRKVLLVHLHRDETWHAEEWDEATQSVRPTEVPVWWENRPFRSGPIQADPPALLGPSFDSRSEEPAWIIAELDADAMAGRYFPELIKRHLSEEFLAEYSFQVVTRGGGRTVFAAAGESPTGEPEGAIPLIRQIRRGAEGPTPLAGRGRPAMKKRGPPPGALGFAGDGIWRLEARHRGGTLENVVARTRARNLAVSTVTLFVLGFALVALGFAVRRSQRLAKLQLEFTAGVSHELRTPLAVIVSAGDNLAGGYIKDPQKVKEYGALVRDEGTRLTGMVDEVLRFSALDAEQAPVQKREIRIQTLLEGVAREMRKPGCEWDVSFEDATFAGDAGALHVAVRNLVENALRHGGGQWVGVRAAKAGEQIVITVEDRGNGISSADLPHIFEPFYRGAESRAQQRKGSGLGLALVERIARAHGGKATAANRAEGGARFTMTIPCG